MVLCGPGRAFAQSEVVEYYALDAIGSVRVVFDVNGNVIGRMDYDPFGAPLASGTGLPSRAYAGLFRDGEAGLDFAQARSYQSRTGRFSTVDTVAVVRSSQRWNRYAYSLNSPVSYTDSSGLLAQGPSSLPSSFCGAEHSFDGCSGDDYFWGSTDAAGFGFGGGIAEARLRGYVPGMPTEIWDGLNSLNSALDSEFAQAQAARREGAREPRPVIYTEISDFRIEDENGKTIELTDGKAKDPFVQLAQDISNRAGAWTQPQIYGEILIISAVGGTAGRFLFKEWYYNPNVNGFERAWSKDFRTGWHRLPTEPGRWWSGRNLPHYHRRPGIGRHRPYEGW
jgi:RHS repeat-associated protein